MTTSGLVMIVMGPDWFGLPTQCFLNDRQSWAKTCSSSLECSFKSASSWFNYFSLFSSPTAAGFLWMKWSVYLREEHWQSPKWYERVKWYVSWASCLPRLRLGLSRSRLALSYMTHDCADTTQQAIFCIDLSRRQPTVGCLFTLVNSRSQSPSSKTVLQQCRPQSKARLNLQSCSRLTPQYVEALVIFTMCWPLTPATDGKVCKCLHMV